MKKLNVSLRFTSFVVAVMLALTLVGAGPQSRSKVSNVSSLEQGPVELYRYRIYLPVKKSKQARKMLRLLNKKGFDIAGVNRQTDQVELIATRKQMDFLESKGLAGEIVARQGPLSEAAALDPQYYSPNEVESKLKQLHSQYPEVTHLIEIARSNQGQPVYALLVSSTPSPLDPKFFEKPSLIMDGLHHAREVMTVEIVMDAAETILANWASNNPRAHKLVSSWQIWFVPMLNVDGSNIVWSSDRWWRKNGWASNSTVYGVDINRNYPYRWGDCDGSSNQKRSDIFRGEAAGSEPETAGLMNLANLVKPTASLSYHSYSELIIYPYGCGGDYTPENTLHRQLAGELSQKLPKDNGRGNYDIGTAWELIYPVDGDSSSFMYASFGAVSFTFEVNTDFQPPYSLREPTLQKHRKAWQYFLSRANSSLLAVRVIDRQMAQPVPAQIAINTIKHIKGERGFSTNSHGYYFKILDPGHYLVTALLADGRSKTIPVEMTGQRLGVEITVD